VTSWNIPWHETSRGLSATAELLVCTSPSTACCHPSIALAFLDIICCQCLPTQSVQVLFIRYCNNLNYLPPTKEEVNAFVCLSVLSVSTITQKTRAWIWMKCCVSTDVGTWTNWLIFEPDPDYSPDAGTGLLSPISYALQRGILLRQENHTYRYWASVAAATRGFLMVLFIASRGNNFVGGTYASPSALLVRSIIARLMLASLFCT